MDERDIAALRRAESAKQVLDNPLVQEVFDSMARELAGAFFNSKPNEVQVRNEAYYMNGLLKRFERAFQQMIATGEQVKLLNRVDEDEK